VSEIAENSVIAPFAQGRKDLRVDMPLQQENFQIAITRENVANHFGLAPNHVSRLFRREGQTRFSDFLNLVRMNRAKFMLRNYG
jgi:AraC-like DNA-binding protein